MKKFYMFALAACTAVSVYGAVPVKAPRLWKSKVSKERNAEVKADDGIWRAATQLVSYWDPDNDKWVVAERYKSTYNDNGDVLQDVITSMEDGSRNRVTYKYNENNLKISELTEAAYDGNVFENYQKKTREYDPIVKTLVVENRDYTWNNNSWSLPGNCWNRNVTRDANGVITGVEVATLYQGEYDPSVRQVNTVGDDGKVSAIKTSQLTYDGSDFVWEDDICYSDIEWEETDGQIYDEIEINETNRVSRAILTQQDGEEGEIVMNLSVNYNDEGYVMTATMTESGMDVKFVSTYQDKPYGGYRVVTEGYVVMDDSERLVQYDEEYAYYDAYGLELEAFYGIGDSKETMETSTHVVGSVEYDSTYGYPVSYQRAYLDVDEDAMVNDIKIDFSDYQNVSGVADVTADRNAPVEYYTIDGVRTDAATPGLYIRRQGSESRKIIIR